MIHTPLGRCTFTYTYTQETIKTRLINTFNKKNKNFVIPDALTAEVPALPIDKHYVFFSSYNTIHDGLIVYSQVPILDVSLKGIDRPFGGGVDSFDPYC
jgi:hypothetical protein